MDKLQWLQERQNYITASDSLFILKEFSETLKDKLKNIHTWNRTRFQIYMEKVMPPEKLLDYQDVNSTDIMEEGKNREQEIADYLVGQGVILDANRENISKLEDLRLSATPDFYINGFESPNSLIFRLLPKEYSDNSILECKLTSPIDEQKIIAFRKKNLNKSDLTDEEIKQEIWNNKILGYEFQVQHQLLCAGLEYGVIAIAIKESAELNAPIADYEYKLVKANKTLHAEIIKTAGIFWKWFEDVKAGIIEAPVCDSQNKKDIDLMIVLRDDLVSLTQDYLEAQQAYKAYEYAKDAIKNRIQSLMGRITTSVDIEQSSGEKIRINQVYTKQTFYTEKDKTTAILKADEAKEKALSIEIGSEKTAPRLYKFNVEII